MKSRFNLNLHTGLRYYPIAASALLIAAGMAVMLGWVTGASALKSVIPGAATMKFNTALCFFGAGLSLWVLKEDAGSPARKRIGRIFAGLVVMLASVTLIEYLTGLDLRIDQLFIPDTATPPASFPGRMSPITAVCFLLGGLALWWIDRKISQYFSLAVSLLAFLAILGYLFDFEALYRLAGFNSIAIHTAIGFLILVTGALAARPVFDIMQVLTSDLAGSRSARVQIPTTLILLILLGLFVESLESRGFVDSDNESIVLIVLVILLYLPLTYINTRTINRSQESLRESEERYRVVSGLTSDYAYRDRIEPDGRIVPEWITDSFIRISGYSLEEARAPDFWMEAIHPDDAPLLLQHTQQILAGNADTAEFRVRTKSGEVRWFKDFANPLWDAGSERVIGFYGAVQDVSAQKNAEARFRLAIESAPYAIVMVDEAGQITLYNSQAEKYFGYARSEILGMTLDMLVPERFRGSHAGYRAGFIAAPQARPMGTGRDLFALRKDGSEFPVEIGLAPVEIPEGMFVMATVVDITERKQTEREIQRLNEDLEQQVADRTAELSQANSLLNAMLENIPDHVFFKDRDSRFIRNSRSQAIMMGLRDPAETIGKSDYDFFPHAQQAFEEEQNVMKSGQPIVDLEEHVVWPDGRETWVSTTKAPLREPGGEIVGIFGIARDITERKQAEKSLRAAKEQMEAANKELEAFSYSVSHDLRAPLRAIDGYSRILLEDYKHTLDGEAKRLFDVVRSEARRMGELIDDLLTFSRLGRAELRHLSIDMTAMAEKTFEELTIPEERMRIDFHLGKLPPASGDPSLMRQVWVNLIANAIKFTSKKDRAVIRIGGASRAGENLYEVKDNGAGFELEYAGKLFGVFQRLHSEGEFEGTGVGLAIVKRVIVRHGGRVWAEGEVDKGAAFHFSLPQQGVPS